MQTWKCAPVGTSWRIEQMNEMSLKQAYSLLLALKNNLPGSIAVDQRYVDQFDIILDTLEKESGQNLDAFRIRESELRSRVTNKNTLTGVVAYSESPEIPRVFVMMKIDAVFGLLHDSGRTQENRFQCSIGIQHEFIGAWYSVAVPEWRNKEGIGLSATEIVLLVLLPGARLRWRNRCPQIG